MKPPLQQITAVFVFILLLGASPLSAGENHFSQSEMVKTGHAFFGKASADLASVIEYAFKKKGKPTAYIVGQQGSGAIIAGLRYGEGWLRMKNGSQTKVFWQGPSLGLDVGGDGTRVMVLVYKLRTPDDIFDRFGGVQGAGFIVGGAGVTFRSNNKVHLAIIRTGLGLRLGVNVGYLKYTRKSTWNPF